MRAAPISEQIDGLPDICGSENQIAGAMVGPPDTSVRESDLDFVRVRSCFAIALHMHQPLIPAGGDDLRSASVISNLKHMMDHPDVGDNHNASVFQWCYKRMGQFIPELVNCRTFSTASRPLRVIPGIGTAWNGWVQHGGIRWRHPLPSKTIDCMWWRGGVTSRLRRWRAAVALLSVGPALSED